MNPNDDQQAVIMPRPRIRTRVVVRSPWHGVAWKWLARLATWWWSKVVLFHLNWLTSLLSHSVTWEEPHQEISEDQPLVAYGTGVRVELNGNCLHIHKGGAFGFFLALLGHHEGGFMEHTIRISDISAVEVDKPALFFHYIRFSYPGSPELTGNDLHDMLAENALLMSMFDNRAMYRIKERIERSMNRQVHG